MQRWSKLAKTKGRTYPEFAESSRCKLVAIETGGRWSEEVAALLWQFAVAKAQEAPSHMRRSVALMWERRWTRMLACSCARAFAASLVEPKRQLGVLEVFGGDAPGLAELCDMR